MQFLQLNLVENESPQAPNSETARPVALAAAKEIVGEKEHSDRQAVASDATLAALASLFGSGCF
jgi:hypothetical protein